MGVGDIGDLSLHRLLRSSQYCLFINYDQPLYNSWSAEQLKMMMFGGNNRAQAFFKQHGWTDGGKIKAKYTSRAADLYRQILYKEVAKSMAEEASLPSSPIYSQSAQASNGLLDVKIQEGPKENHVGKKETHDVSVTPKFSSHSVTSSVKKPLGRLGGLVLESLHIFQFLPL